jgi:hypothetical protein
MRYNATDGIMFAAGKVIVLPMMADREGGI